MPDYILRGKVVAFPTNPIPGISDGDWTIYGYGGYPNGNTSGAVLASNGSPFGVSISPLPSAPYAPGFTPLTVDFTLTLPSDIADFTPAVGDGSITYNVGHTPVGVMGGGDDSILYNHPIMCGWMYFKYILDADYTAPDGTHYNVYYEAYSTPANWGGVGLSVYRGGRIAELSTGSNDDFQWSTWEYGPERIWTTNGAVLTSIVIDWGDGSAPESLSIPPTVPGVPSGETQNERHGVITQYGPVTAEHEFYTSGTSVITTTLTDSWGRSSVYIENAYVDAAYHARFVDAAVMEPDDSVYVAQLGAAGGRFSIIRNGAVDSRASLGTQTQGGAYVWRRGDGKVYAGTYRRLGVSVDDGRVITGGLSAYEYWPLSDSVTGTLMYAYSHPLQAGAVASIAIKEVSGTYKLWFRLVPKEDHTPMPAGILVDTLPSDIWATEAHFFYVFQQRSGTIVVTDWRTRFYTSNDHGRTWQTSTIDVWGGSPDLYRYTGGIEVEGDAGTLRSRFALGLKVTGSIPDGVYSLWFTSSTNTTTWITPVEVESDLPHQQPFALVHLSDGRLWALNGEAESDSLIYESMDYGRTWSSI